MKDETINVGDLVMVVRWPHACTNPKMPIGKPFRVAMILKATDPICNLCRRRVPDGHTYARPEGWKIAGIPLPWLKKLPPLALPDTVTERDEETA